MPDKTATITPLFIQSSRGRVFAVHHLPANGVTPSQTLLYLPPFAEEMNRSRRMASLQAQALSARGFGVLLLDPFGTGDSEGDFGEARWESWLDDVIAAADWLQSQGDAKICLWGLRFGALLACVAASRQPGRFQRLLLWQPVLEGKALMTQFLRIRLAASLGDRSGETTDGLRNILATGSSIEVAGYELAPELVAALDRIKLSDISLRSDTRVDWLELVRKANDPLLPASQRIVDAWRANGANVRPMTAPGDPFWNIQETTNSPEFIEATTRAFQASPVDV